MTCPSPQLGIKAWRGVFSTLFGYIIATVFISGIYVSSEHVCMCMYVCMYLYTVVFTPITDSKVFVVFWSML